MADDETARDGQANTEGGRQREREHEETGNRADDAEPIRDDPGQTLGDLDEALEPHDYPTTADALIESSGDHEVETQAGWTSSEAILGPIDNETYDSADDARTRIRWLIHR